MTNSRLFCCKCELCCDFLLFGVIHIAFDLVNILLYFKKKTNLIYEKIVASIVVWWSYFAHSCGQIHFTLYCCKSTNVVIYTPILDKRVLAQSLLM